MEKNLREFQKMLRDGQLKLLSMERTGGGHYRATIEAPDGRKLVYVMSSTASDHRAATNRKRDIKRFFNN